ncbi:MAG TPA: ATP-dependent DNA helicase RecG, partial [Treponemataceae bacterium]|nr:ATP-dependent DNA helicase RecG [Treponemataceae bacterium]
THDQLYVIAEINNDIDTSYNSISKNEKTPLFSAARLLQGDVGSGKTLVAFFVALRIIDLGGQIAFLAPTEILAKQHAENAAKLLEPITGKDRFAKEQGVRVAFLTGNIKAKSRTPLLKALKAAEIDIIIGTHALFSDQVQYYDLRLVIIDEQQRFGVVQRNAIVAKGQNSLANKSIKNFTPNVLMMSATPIPQTLALTVYGDLDVSTIKTMPAGRKPIKTYLTVQGHENRVYEAVREEITKGHQAYFVYPLIEASEDKDLIKPMLKSAEEQYNFLSTQVYPEFRCAIVHSKIEDVRQSQILQDFNSGKIQILIATTVVEVGVDVPNATCMVIEQAERFGLAALHQLRGRIGRGVSQSFCFLIYAKKLTEIGTSRLQIMRENNDGFLIAEKDLQLRGPGEVTGIQQSGYLTLGIADPIRDKEILELAHKEAINTIMSKKDYAT